MPLAELYSVTIFRSQQYKASNMTLNEIADHLENAHRAMQEAANSVAGQQPGAKYELYTDQDEVVPDFKTLAEAVRAHA